MTSGKHQVPGSRRDGIFRSRFRGQRDPGLGQGGSEDPGTGPDCAAEQMVTKLYAAHYRQLVRLAVLLVHDLPTAQEIVQDSFVALHGAWRRRGGDSPLSYLRQSVVSRSRSVLHCRTENPGPLPSALGAAAGHPMTGLADPVVIRALAALPAQQREALVLNYYAGLSDAQIGAAMGISKQTAQSHIARAMDGLRAVLDQAPEPT
jgi:DNA-directed RNA polymerase specialized sigma24 family protein